ncbi:pilus assembly protein PilM [Anatilimnocola sp. NA78]|uniref:pilus assembly protein PilM n=1 Tax=Anatilimnocola sp. NA78 TaxID=3415683 RepID=UPI003CE4E255
MTMSAPAIDFDPYRDWLKINDETRPLNAYQLLRATPLETELSKLRVAFNRQMDLLEAHSDSHDSERLESLRRELQNAIELLCDAERKAVLDAQIRRRANSNTPQPSSTAVAAAGNSVCCRNCSQPNAANRRFCGDCGQPLWEKCPQCAAECSVNERFCGGCGANIRGELDGKERSYREQLASAQQAAEAYQFDTAISRYRKLAAIDDVRFESLAREALAAIEQIEQRRPQLRAQTEETLSRCQQLVAEHSYEQAISLLSEVHPALRTPAIDKLLDRAQASRQELLQLSGEIRQAMETKAFTGLLLRIERLLALKPGHAQAVGIANQLREYFYKQAKAKVASGKYAEALTLLDQIPDTFRTPEITALADTAAELSTLLDTLNNAPLADDSLLALADKLAKFVPQNEEVSKLRQRLVNRLTKLPTDARLGVPDWQPPAIKSAVGPPVDWLANFTRLVPADKAPGNKAPGDEKVKLTLKEHPGEFFVALGLALQGVEQAEVPLNLMTAEKGSVLSQFKSVFGRKAPAMAWGIDVGDHALKAIKLVRDEKTGDISIAACEHLQHATSLGGADADMLRGEVQEKTLTDFASRHDLKGCQIITTISAQRVLGRFCELPPLPAKKVPAAVQFEAKHQFPIPLEELKWAYYVLNEATGIAAKDDSPRRVMIVAARSSHVLERVSLFKRAGIEVSVLQSECVALHNAIRFEFATPGAGDEKPAGEDDTAIAVVDIGVSSTSVLISSASGLWFRTFGQAGNNFTNQLVKQFQVTHEQAEQLKRAPSRARRYHLFQAAMQPVVAQLAGEIERSLSSYQKQRAAVTVRRLYGIGGGFSTHGLIRQLRYGK